VKIRDIQAQLVDSVFDLSQSYPQFIEGWVGKARCKVHGSEVWLMQVRLPILSFLYVMTLDSEEN
jgi:hypothetical protein